ncbi:MAG: hypothetical protein PHP05_09545 [Sideroxydans sp.]|nr:hypothetical protein [Sideroxydans sp.]
MDFLDHFFGIFTDDGALQLGAEGGHGAEKSGALQIAEKLQDFLEGFVQFGLLGVIDERTQAIQRFFIGVALDERLQGFGNALQFFHVGLHGFHQFVCVDGLRELIQDVAQHLQHVLHLQGGFADFSEPFPLAFVETYYCCWYCIRVGHVALISR